MKKAKFITLLVLIVLSCLISCRPKPDMPSFNLLLSDSVSTLNTNNIPTGKTSILVLFSPDCEHCQKETSDILLKMDSLKEVSFYFITIDPMDRMRVFNAYYHLKKYPNITVAQDYSYSTLKYFTGVAPPSSFIYDKYKRLRGVFKGATSASQLIDFINKM